MVPAPRAGAHTESRFGRQIQVKSTKNVALHFRENTTPHPTKSMTYTTTNHANCRRWVKLAGVGIRLFERLAVRPALSPLSEEIIAMSDLKLTSYPKRFTRDDIKAAKTANAIERANVAASDQKQRMDKLKVDLNQSVTIFMDEWINQANLAV